MAVVSAVDATALEDWIIANAPGFVRGMREADRDIAAGRVIALEDALNELRPRRVRRPRPSRQAIRKT